MEYCRSSRSSRPHKAKRKEPLGERKNVTNACESCRKLKVKCDGQSKCSSCLQRKSSCRYTSQEKRGPKKPKIEAEEDNEGKAAELSPMASLSDTRIEFFGNTITEPKMWTECKMDQLDFPQVDVAQIDNIFPVPDYFEFDLPAFVSFES
eukprot:TRINITY_DN639_c0_g1_i1.p1 TRINITY_DN639_c0_g1~~TRINITY_DN639_c0_g1_i1.p1  ORF type:complete len:150 (-),score=24.44 TRINITY_DN639_c0_g1_i1:82-531(-)